MKIKSKISLFMMIVMVSVVRAEGESEGSTCNQKLLQTYGLQGYSNSKTVLHKHCPMITQNCCTPDDELISLHMWNGRMRNELERYYGSYIITIRYLLGFAGEAHLLAKKYEESDDLPECQQAAHDFLSLGLNQSLIREIYSSIVNSSHRVGDLRRGFFCILCDGLTHNKLKDFWNASNKFYKERVYFSKEFCRKTVEFTIKSSYYKVFFFKKYLESMSKLVNCRTNNDNTIVYQVPFLMTQQIKNCYYFRNRYFFFYCESYCQNYHLTKSSTVFDGNIGQLRKFVSQLIGNRHVAFENPNNNFLVGGIGFEEDYLDNNFGELFVETVFFKSENNLINLDNFQTDVVYYGGIDPWESVNNSDYTINVKGANVLRGVILGLSLFLFIDFK